MSDLDSKRELLLEVLRGLQSCAVAFSAGVDSTVVAKAAQLALGDSAVAVTSSSDSLAEGELEEAQQLAQQIGIRHLVISTEEFQNPQYTSNQPDRCYHCKTELYTKIEALAEQLGVAAIVDAAMTILVPLFHRLSRSELAPMSDSMPIVETEAIDAEITTLKERIAELERIKHAKA